MSKIIEFLMSHDSCLSAEPAGELIKVASVSVSDSGKVEIIEDTIRPMWSAARAWLGY